MLVKIGKKFSFCSTGSLKCDSSACKQAVRAPSSSLYSPESHYSNGTIKSDRKSEHCATVIPKIMKLNY